MIRGLTRGQATLRLVMLAGPLAALFATVPAGATPATWLALLVGGLAAGWALLPESALGTCAFVFVLAWWGIGLRDGLHPAAIGAAAALLAAHVAALLAASGPGSVAVDPAVLRLWVRRGLLVLLPAPLVWVVAETVRDRPEPPGIWLAGLAALFGAVVVANLLYRRRPG